MRKAKQSVVFHLHAVWVQFWLFFFV